MNTYNNMIMPDRTEICPKCGGEMWQYQDERVQCLKCWLWGWLPPKDNVQTNNKKNQIK